jgi:hypothetical protein
MTPGGQIRGARGEFADVPAMIRAAKQIVLLAAANGTP